MIRELRELADYWESDTEEAKQIHAAITEIKRLQDENAKLHQENRRIQAKVDRLEGYKHSR